MKHLIKTVIRFSLARASATVHERNVENQVFKNAFLKFQLKIGKEP
jgi:hypothetical protein